MKKVLVLTIFALSCLCAFAQAQSEIPTQPYRVPAITPEPAYSEISPTVYYPLTLIEIECPDAEAVKWAGKHLKGWYGKLAPEVRVSVVADTGLGEEAYDLIVGQDKVSIKAQTLQGVRYALYSLRQIAMPERGGEDFDRYIAPKCVVRDSPALSFRGIHICWFHEREPWEIEKMIRLAAYYKINYAVIESWGTYKSKVAPWYGWPDGTMTNKEIARLKKIADDLGITLIPQINVLGHASMSRGGPGKHSALDFHPEYQHLFEPDTWNWCISNPACRKLLVDLIEERMEAFGNPPFFHIGADEAHDPSCPACINQPYSELMMDHINTMCETIRKKGARPMMWHDMLLERDDPRWKGFKAHGTPETAAGLLKFPKDVVICDWYYEEVQESYPTMDHFKSLGFTTLTCPWNHTEGTMSMGKYAREGHADGMLGTMWHHDFGKDFVKGYLYLANSAWNAGAKWKRNQVKIHLRHILWDMKVKDYKRTGTYIYELPDEYYLDN